MDYACVLCAMHCRLLLQVVHLPDKVSFVSFQIELAECRCKSAVAKVEKLEVRVSELEREKKALEKKGGALQSKVDKESEALKEEKEVNLVGSVYVCVCISMQ